MHLQKKTVDISGLLKGNLIGGSATQINTDNQES